MAIPLVLLILIPFILLSKWTDSACIMTSNKDVLLAGETLDASCIWDDRRDGSNVTFRFIQSQDNLDNFTKNVHGVARLVINNTTRWAGKSRVICMRDREVGCNKIIMIGYPPVPPTNITCVCYNLRNMTCRWDQVKTEEDLKIPTNWIAMYSIGNRSKRIPCPVPTSATMCVWPEEDFKAGFEYNMYVESINRLDTASSTELVIDPNQKVKPDSVEISNITVNPRNLSFQMSLPNLCPIIQFFEYCIEYSCSTNRSNLTGIHRSNEIKKVSLTSLLPNYGYTISVWIKPNNSGFWSDRSQFTDHTEEDVPDGSPTITSVTRTSVQSSGNRIYIYWLPLEGVLRNGKITGYELNLLWPNGWRTANTPSLYPPITVEDIEEGESYLLKMAALTKVGRGPFSSLWKLHPSSQDLAKIPDVWAENLQNGSEQTTTRVVWMSPNTTGLLTYHVYHCHGQSRRKLDTFMAYCQGELKVNSLNSTSLSTDKTMVFDMVLDNPKDIVLGVSATNSNGETSDITWAECLSTRGKALTQIQDVKVQDSDSESLDIEWDIMPCEVIVERFQVSYWPTSRKSINSCEQGTFKQDFQLWRKAKYLTLKHLQEATRYSFCIRAISTAGRPGPWSKIVEGETTTPTPVLEIVIGAVLIVFVSIGVIVIIRKRHTWRQDMDIRVPPNIPDSYRGAETYYSEDENYETVGGPCYPHLGLLTPSSEDSRSQKDDKRAEECSRNTVRNLDVPDNYTDTADLLPKSDSANLRDPDLASSLSTVHTPASDDFRSGGNNSRVLTSGQTHNKAALEDTRLTTDRAASGLESANISAYVTSYLNPAQNRDAVINDDYLPIASQDSFQGYIYHVQLNENEENGLRIGLSNDGTGFHNVPSSELPQDSSLGYVFQNPRLVIPSPDQAALPNHRSGEPDRLPVVPGQNISSYTLITSEIPSPQSNSADTNEIVNLQSSYVDTNQIAFPQSSYFDTSVISGYSQFCLEDRPENIPATFSSETEGYVPVIV